MDGWWVLIVAVRAVSPAADDQWATRLAELDHARGRAFSSADPTLLGEVYAPGSRARRQLHLQSQSCGSRTGSVTVTQDIVQYGAWRYRILILLHG